MFKRIDGATGQGTEMNEVMIVLCPFRSLFFMY